MSWREVEIVEVGPRDGFQGIGPFIGTAQKIDFIRRLSEAGLGRIELGSFVSSKAVPQMADIENILHAARTLLNLAGQVLVPNLKYGLKAVQAGADHLVFVISASDAHSKANARLSTWEAAEEFGKLVVSLPAHVQLRVDVATAFDCPFEGRLDLERLLSVLDRVIPIAPEAEYCLCDTTGRADPAHVADAFAAVRTRYGEGTRWALHAHDTYGLGMANILSAWRVGIGVFDASFAGLGGCPFAPGATGNVATEDVVWMFERMGVKTGVDLGRLYEIALDGAQIPGGQPGGRVRDAMTKPGR